MNDILNLINIIQERQYKLQSRYIILNNVKLSQNAINVLESAFGENYDHHPSYTNMYDLANGSKAMDWWNFPWDLQATQQPTYAISFKDMEDILRNVIVKTEKDSYNYVKYSKKLADTVLKLNAEIMNAHGGIRRVIKILYCVRNFMLIANDKILTEDINNLEKAVEHLLHKIDLTKLAKDDDKLYTNSKDLYGNTETRTKKNGLAELEKIYLLLHPDKAIPGPKILPSPINLNQQLPFHGMEYTTLYGTGKYLNKMYSVRETLLCFENDQAFQGDNAYRNTIKSYGKKNYCHEEIPIKRPACLRILSFNVHNFHMICNDNIKKNPQHTIDYVKRCQPDLVLLQEYVPYININDDINKYKNCPSSMTIPVDFSYMDTKMAFNGFNESVKCNDFELVDKPYHGGIFMGKAIYTKEPIINAMTKIIGKKPGTNRDRGYLRIIYKVPNQNLHILVYTVHLTFLNNSATKQEIDTLVSVIRDEQKFYKIDNVLIMGDFNNSPFINNIFDSLRNNNYTLLNDKTVSAFNQNTNSGETIDLAWVNDGFLNNFDICNSKSPSGYKVIYKSNVSDHYPIILDIKPK
ncbi:endonuclease/exonuclease/phosphatase family protein [Klosneuvirus KNV1]|uniref:Endonuclease/exonuclease/phosphatase family protein n=1 Tax=Klosneuvirus KNV1 TaxID=1977640 RepID=A0A1V0SJ98_9VIRU|nr:endonuclease/exonuclease/phosphatase family protein [Klosneuvirus KNV1]